MRRARSRTTHGAASDNQACSGEYRRCPAQRRRSATPPTAAEGRDVTASQLPQEDKASGRHDPPAAGLRDVTSAEAVLRVLLDGNRRFTLAAPRYRRDIHSARASAAEQHPMAAVFTCVDSRVTVESLFDCDFGQLIVVRTAGHVADRAAAASLQYAADHLSVPLAVVLGHERCGAISSAVQAVASEQDEGNYLAEQLREPATQALRENPADPNPGAMRRQIGATVAALRPQVSAAVVGACYDLDTGVVEVISR